MRGCRFFMLLGLVLSASNAHAGAWLMDSGHGLAIGHATYYSTTSYFDKTGKLQSQPRFSKYELQPYAEYGVTRWLTLGGSAYLQTVSQSGITHYGIADPELFARLPLYQSGPHMLSVQPLMKFSSHFNEASSPRGGSTSTDKELSLLYGYNLHLLSTKDYLDTRAGYRWRSDGMGDQFRGDVALGLGVTDKIQIVPALRAVATLNRQDAVTFSENGDLDYSVLKAEVTGIYHLNEQQWIEASIFKHVAGIQTGDGQGVTLGFAQRF